MREITYKVLEILARDQLVKVRQILAETLKDVADAPPEIVRRLARDEELAVAGPVLRFSPVLADEDLVEIIRSCPVRGALAEISRRARVGEPVADAIVASDDVEAVTALLRNPSAQIREETLDHIIDRAPDVAAWHGPLVRRPQLSPHAVRRITRFVADSLLEVLQKRGDIDSGTAFAVKVEMRRRLTGEGAAHAAKGKAASPMSRARKCKAEGRLDEKALGDALAAGDRAFVTAALSLLTREPAALIDKIVEAKSAKGVAALAWKAGLSMRFAVQLQLRFAHVAPSAVLYPRGGDRFPLRPQEMEWQLEFFRSMVPAPGRGGKARQAG